MANKQELIDYLVKNGKTLSWEELANKFGFKNGERARATWLNYRQKNPHVFRELTKKIVNRVLGEKAETGNYIAELEDRVIRFEEDFVNKKAELVAETETEIRSLDDLIKVCKIDTNKWEITKYTQSAAGNRFSVKAWLNAKQTQALEDSFTEFLKSYIPKPPAIEPPKPTKRHSACLIINKQDAHLNKHDIYGSNDIEERFSEIYDATETIIKKAQLTSNLEEVIYILGSDQFNSEFTDTTTKGTPQKNMVGFHEGFEAICNHEIAIINTLLQNSQHVSVAFLAGNHDEFVGWHLVKWLEAYYRDESRIEFETEPDYRKYANYSNSAFMFNHGDAIKPEKLAGLFPIEYKEEWSDADHYYIFTGDKHNTLAKDINGIQFYQIPSLSKAKSSWDDKNGYTVTKAEMTAFLITEDRGMSDIYKHVL